MLEVGVVKYHIWWTELLLQILIIQGSQLKLSNNAIQELQFISETFNAEYGQAMSGIVNIITKDGSYENFRKIFWEHWRLYFR